LCNAVSRLAACVMPYHARHPVSRYCITQATRRDTTQRINTL